MGPGPGFAWSANGFGAGCKSLSELASNDLTLLLLFSLNQWQGDMRRPALCRRRCFPVSPCLAVLYAVGIC